MRRAGQSELTGVTASLRSEEAQPARAAWWWAFVLFVLAAPLVKGGNRALPLAVLELAAIGLLLGLVLRHPRGIGYPSLPRILVAAGAVLLVYPLLQLVPLPPAWWRALPGHAPYAEVIDTFADAAAAGRWRPISLVPAATAYGWLALLLPLAAVLAVRVLTPARVATLLVAMTVLAGLQSLIGLLQVVAGDASMLYLGNRDAFGTATGTFVNRNHLAALLAMMLPPVVGLMVYQRRRARHGGSRFDEAGANLVAQRALVFASAALMLLCLVFTRSRAGIAFALAGLACSSILLVRGRGETWHARLAVGGVVVVGLALAAAIGLAPVAERLEPDALRLSGAGRLALYAAVLRGAVDLLPFGSGLSTFASVFPRFQEGVGGASYDYAHNDYLQALFELGVPGVLVVALLVTGYVVRMAALVRHGSERSFTLLQIAAGIGLLPVMLHSAFDFPLRMPGNAVWFATLAGVLLHPGLRDPGSARASSAGSARGGRRGA
ncbi:MAG: O-antigen ligase family protein [Burkholderiales bacterium]|nr:O-antigen ligase family protein [Burkholderiales bacterium]